MKKRKWLFGLGAFVLAFAMVVTAMPYTIPQITAEAATYHNNYVNEGTELFDVGKANTFSYLRYAAPTQIETDGGWTQFYQDLGGGNVCLVFKNNYGAQSGNLTGRWIRVTFDNVGTMNNRPVRGVMTFNNFLGNAGGMDFFFGWNDANYVAVPQNFWSGFYQSKMQEMTVEIQLFYADTGQQISLEGLYTTIGSLNWCTDVAGSFDGYGEAVRLNYDGPVETYRLPNDRSDPWKQWSPISSKTTGIAELWGWYLGACYDFEDTLGSDSFLKSAVSFKIPSSTLSLSYMSQPGNVAWYTFNLSPFGSSAIPPEKTVENLAGNNINGTALYPGDPLVYRTNQRIEILGVDGTARYKTFTMTDTVPDGLDIQRVELQQKTAGGSSYSLLPSNSYSYQITKNANGTQTVTLTLNNPNSNNPWLYNGETLSMAIVCRVNEQMWNYTTFGRNAAVAINGHNRDTNSVTNSISYRILTNAVNGTIDEDETRILRGSDRTIHFSPNEGYYLKSLTVDGANVPVTAGMDSYTFHDIVKNHEIRAVFARDPVITITKQIDRDTVVWAKGAPIFTYKITGTDYLGISRTYYRVIAFEEADGLDTKSITLKIPAGEWTVTELETNDWGLTRVTAGTACKVQGTAGILDTRNSDTANVTFLGEVSDYSNYTHNNVGINQLK